MRIAFILQHFDESKGGAERYIVGLGLHLLDKGHEVHVFCATANPALRGFHIHPLHLGGKAGGAKLKYFSQQSEKAVKAEGYFDVTQFFESTLYGDVYQPHSGVHLASRRQNLLASPNPFVRLFRKMAGFLNGRELWRNFAERKIYSENPNRVFVPLSRMVAGHMADHYGIPEKRMRLVYNGTDLNRFHPGRKKETSKRLRSEVGIGEELVFLFVSLNFRRKGLHKLIEAAAIMKNRTRRCDFNVLVVGKGNIASYQSLADKLGIGSNVIFAGERNNAADWYLAGDVFVLPTFYDPCSLVIFESLASGLPTITTRQNGAGEIITEGREGHIVSSPDDTDGLAECMGRYFDPDYLSKHSLAARHLAEQYPIRKSYDSMENLYREIAEGKKSAPGEKTAQKGAESR